MPPCGYTDKYGHKYAFEYSNPNKYCDEYADGIADPDKYGHADGNGNLPALHIRKSGAYYDKRHGAGFALSVEHYHCGHGR